MLTAISWWTGGDNSAAGGRGRVFRERRKTGIRHPCLNSLGVIRRAIWRAGRGDIRWSRCLNQACAYGIVPVATHTGKMPENTWPSNIDQGSLSNRCKASLCLETQRRQAWKQDLLEKLGNPSPS